MSNFIDLGKILEAGNCDLHVHTKYSFDSFLCPKKIAAFAARRKKYIAVTDHEEIRGALEAKKHDGANRIIVGEEIRTTDWGGEILAFGIREKINSGPAREVIEKIHGQGGLAVLSHPFREGYVFRKKARPVPREIIKKIDGVEVYNARNRKSENKKALELAEKHGKIKTRGSDAHMLWELYFMERNNILLNLLKNLLTFFIKITKNN